jgi:pimeloyl-ACP methyl ester carboxylesterase
MIQTQENVINFQEHQIYTKQWIVDETQQQSPIILLHESLGSTELWKDFPEVLAETLQRNIISYDRIGFGLSSALTEDLPLDFIAREVQTFSKVLDAYQLEHCILLGHSVGGAMAVAIAAQLHSKCDAVITLAAQSMVEQVTLDGISQAKATICQNPKFLSSLQRYHGEKTQWVLDAWTETWLHPNFKDWKIDHFLQQLHSPLLVLHGENDQYATVAQAERFIQLVATPTRLAHILRGCGHFPHKEQPEKVLKAIQMFLKSII